MNEKIAVNMLAIAASFHGDGVVSQGWIVRTTAMISTHMASVIRTPHPGNSRDFRGAWAGAAAVFAEAAAALVEAFVMEN
jgi:hypothetical protein